MLDAPCFKRNFCRAQQCLAQITVVVGTGRRLHSEELTMLSKILQNVVIDYNPGSAYIPITIITTHMPRNDAAAPGHVCPGIRIHAIDIVQPPGIGISPIADMDAHQTIVTAALAAKSSAETPKKARWEARSDTMRREISRPPVAPTKPTTCLRACRTRRGDATRRRHSRCAPWG